MSAELLVKAAHDFHRALSANQIEPGMVEVTLEDEAWYRFEAITRQHFAQSLIKTAQAAVEADGHEITLHGITFVRESSRVYPATLGWDVAKGSDETVIFFDEAAQLDKSDIAALVKPGATQWWHPIESNYLNNLNKMSGEEHRKYLKGEFDDPLMVYDPISDSVIGPDTEIGWRFDAKAGIVRVIHDFESHPSEPKPYANAFDIAKAMIESKD